MTVLLSHFPSFVQFADSAGNLIGGSAKKICTGGCDSSLSVTTLIPKVVNLLVFLVGAVSVIMIIVGGLRYVLSNGDPKAVSAAKSTIVYAISGLVIALLAFAIVHFITTSL